MLGTSKQVRWAIEIRDSKLNKIKLYSQKSCFFSARQVSEIQAVLGAQQDAGWWIDNRDVTPRSLMLWAANHLRLIPEQHRSSTKSTDAVHPLSLSELNPSTLVQEKSNSWIAIIDNEEPITSKSGIINLSIIEQVDEKENEPDFYLLHQSKASKNKNSHPLYRLLQSINGGWSMKGWSFLTLYRNLNSKFCIEGITGELIIAVSFMDELSKLRVED